MIRAWLASHPWVRSNEITETEALALLAAGFDACRSEPTAIVFTTANAEITLEDGKVRRWYLSPPEA